MAFFKFEFGRSKRGQADEIRSDSPENPQTNLSNPDSWLIDMWGSPTSSGVSVTEETAIKFSAVYACVKILSETIASLPFNILKEDGNIKQIARDHPLFNLVHNEPNSIMTSFQFRQLIQASALLWGNGYALILRTPYMRPTYLKFIHPKDVDPYIVTLKDKTQARYYKVAGIAKPVPDTDMIHISALSFDGVKGKSPIEVARENIGLGLAQEKFGADFFKNDASFSGYIKHPGKLNQTGQENLSKSWSKKYSGEGNRFKTPVLEEGSEFISIGIPPEQAQWIASRKFQLEEVARIYGVPLHMLANLDRSTNNNIEFQGIEFVQNTLRSWIVNWEQEFNKKIFREDEKHIFYVKFNLQGLLRGDSVTRSDYYTKMRNMGVMSANEIRLLEDMNPIEDGDTYLIPLNMADPSKINNQIKP